MTVIIVITRNGSWQCTVKAFNSQNCIISGMELANVLGADDKQVTKQRAL